MVTDQCVFVLLYSTSKKMIVSLSMRGGEGGGGGGGRGEGEGGGPCVKMDRFVGFSCSGFIPGGCFWESIFMTDLMICSVRSWSHINNYKAPIMFDSNHLKKQKI